MAYAKVKTAAVPKRKRATESRFESTPEWQSLRADLKGLKRGESLQITFEERDYKRIGLKARRSVARFVQKYLEKQGHDYRVKTFYLDGKDFIVVSAE